jgi:predicted  nucleic acid-binding Zn-ribbon protein
MTTNERDDSTEAQLAEVRQGLSSIREMIQGLERELEAVKGARSNEQISALQRAVEKTGDAVDALKDSQNERELRAQFSDIREMLEDIKVTLQGKIDSLSSEVKPLSERLKNRDEAGERLYKRSLWVARAGVGVGVTLFGLGFVGASLSADLQEFYGWAVLGVGFVFISYCFHEDSKLRE